MLSIFSILYSHVYSMCNDYQLITGFSTKGERLIQKDYPQLAILTSTLSVRHLP